MTTYRAPEPSAPPRRPAERAMIPGLVLAALAALGWLGGMVWTLAAWST